MRILQSFFRQCETYVTRISLKIARKNGPVVGQMTDAHVATAGDHPFLMLWTISYIYSPVNKEAG
jgi:hypothetical protein